MTLSYPEVSIQGAIDPSPWWVKEDNKARLRGRLIRAFFPHVDQVPYTITVIGRADASVHDEATVRIEPLRFRQRQPSSHLPVAAMPSYPGEVRVVQRAKRRPALILSEGGDVLPKDLTKARPKYQISQNLLVAPFYGTEADGRRGGFPPALLDRVRRCEFPQYMCDRLPTWGGSESVLRFDHIQPIGKHHDSIEWTEFCLGEDAMSILDEWITWIMTGYLPEDGMIFPVRQAFLSMG
jgi:hypothetical protein